MKVRNRRKGKLTTKAKVLYDRHDDERIVVRPMRDRVPSHFWRDLQAQQEAK